MQRVDEKIERQVLINAQTVQVEFSKNHISDYATTRPLGTDAG
jgi:hypothetical protein